MASASRRGQLPLSLSLLLIAPLLLLLAWSFFLPIGKLLLTSVTEPTLSLDNYRRLLVEPLYRQVIFRTLWIALICTISALLLGYPIAALMARPGHLGAKIALVCVMIPLWTSALIRSYAWIMLMQRKGVINSLLLAWDPEAMPWTMLYTNGAVLMAMTHVLLPFMVLPIASALGSISPDLPRAALNLGAGRVRTFFSVTLPLSLPGVFAGCLLVFVMSLGFYVTPALVGGPQTLMIATLIAEQATTLLNWPFAGAISCVLLVMSLGLTIAFKRLLRLDRVVAHD
ncbi:ABC transporter permease [Teichococcus vastitatis]|jgi:mannopine transport system permease protein|uniref:ABC transporter permease n=1 Tax=Teichococcus vastitatis TaxID=2307076 RepID=A0ABS9W2S6_9PROT|nr:ABC transporter permease [Pseudoroseomonas vastitatis]MCI0753476.1 ABC transporter permease [Pseudoroseomonas vastitatis]